MYKVSISGKANSGKNTLSKLLFNNIFGYGVDADRVVKDAFANPMKEIIMLMFPNADREALYGPSFLRSNIIPDAFDSAGNPLTYRQALIDIGSRGREYNPNIWIDIVKDNISRAPTWFCTCDTMGFCVTDVRYINEFEMLRDNGFFNIRIIRDDVAKINHKSEVEQEAISNKDFDYVIYNNGSLEAFESKVEILASFLKSKQG
jgi:hypothetical protein